MRVFVSLSTFILAAFASPNACAAFQSNKFACRQLPGHTRVIHRPKALNLSEEKKGDLNSKSVDMVSDSDKDEEPSGTAATNTINERLMEELQEATYQEKGGANSSLGKKLGLDAFRSDKSEEEREAAVEEARNLNGVNPGVALTGAAFALAGAAGLWQLTNFLAEYFVLHPAESDVYAVERATAVMRNVVIGIVTLASGFFGVTGLGIFLLGVRVAYGVATGELDPTPIKKSKQEEIEMPNVWDLMMNKKPGRKR